MDHFGALFQREKMPIRICCDANHLPFRNHSFPFIFCYEFLHHFPALKPVLQEIFRVLSSGYFFFDEEPFKRWLKVVLYQQKDKIYSENARKKNPYLILLESFISEAPCDETAHGIIENNNISIAEWLDALSVFDERELELFSINDITSQVDHHLSLRNVPNFLLGGRISGLCRQAQQTSGSNQGSIFSRFACPECTIPTTDGRMDRSPLIQLENTFYCPQCAFHYPIKDGVIFLLPKSEIQQLYWNL
jgi:uncharacterized protein YbaR (Trm112 family)